MPLVKDIATDYEVNDTTVQAGYWVVDRIEIEFYKQVARANMIGYNKKSAFTRGKRILATRDFEWHGTDGLNGFPFTRAGNIERQMETAITAYISRDPITGEQTYVEFTGATQE